MEKLSYNDKNSLQVRWLFMYFVEKTKGINFLKRFDYILFFAVILITLIGIVAVRSATLTMTGSRRMMITQLAGITIGIIAALIMSRIDYKDFKTLGVLYYIGCIGLLVLVLFIGTGEDLGSRSWLKVGPVTIQPSEFAKIGFILVISIFLERIRDGNYTAKDVIKLLLYTVIPIGLVIAQHDFGTTLVYIFIFFVMVFIAGVPYKYILGLGGAFTASLPFLWFFVLNENRRNRIRVFLNPEMDPLKAGYNTIKSKIAIGSGQIYGQGLFQGIQTQSKGVPVRESDFIFTVIGEELGFIGAVAVIVLIFFIILRCIFIARNARDNYGAFMVSGVVAMLAFHSFENIGMTMGLLPVTGVPLPFVSHGATSIISNYLAIGIVLSVSIRRKKTIFNMEE